MDAIEFIEKDVKRGSANRSITRILASIGAVLIPIALGVGLRDGLDGVFTPRILIPNLVAAVLLGVVISASYGRLFSSFTTWRWSRWGLVCAMILAIDRVVFPIGVRTSYPSQAIFWQESLRCFTKGSVSAVVLGAWLILFAFGFSSIPSRRWRVLISFAAGVSSTVMLGFHCDSSSWEHVLYGHVGPGAAVGTALVLIQELLFKIKLGSALPSLAGKIRNPSKIG